MKFISLWLALCLFGVAVLPATAAITREPYLQSVTPTSITIVWQTDLNSASNSLVQYGTVAGNLNQSAFGGGSISPSNPSVKNHVVTITGLSSATTYFYNIGTVTDGVQGGGTINHYFVTAPVVSTATPFTAWIVGDDGDAGADQAAVRDAMLAVTGANPPDLYLHVGDMAYDDGTDQEFTVRHFSVHKDILRHTPLWPTLGNHEARNSSSASGIGPYYEAYVLPTGGEAGGVASGTEAFYSFDYANVHFVVLDSMDSDRAIGSPMYNWLQTDLSATTQEWVIVFFHHPPYTKGSHDSDSFVDSGGRLVDMRENLLPLLEAGGVDLVLAGHSHIYERSFLINQVYGYGSSPNFATPNFSTLQANGNILDDGDGDLSGDGAYEKQHGSPNDGTVYVVSGHGGRSIGSGSADHPVMFFSEKEFGSVLLDINGSSLTIRNVRTTQAITDTFSIIKASLGHFVLRNTVNGDVGIWLVNGLNLGATGIPAVGVAADWVIKGLGDLDGDGKDDIVLRNSSTGDVVGWLGTGGLAIGATGVIANPGTAWDIVGLGDLDGDGKDDIVWRHPNGDVAAWLGNGLTLGATGIITTALAADWVIVGLGDLDGDGKDDIVVRNSSTGDVGAWLGNGLTLGTTGLIGNPGTIWNIVGLGDLDGDGKDDIVWRHPNGDVAAWLGNGLTLGATGVIANPGTIWNIANLRDLDDDGKDDIVFRNNVDGDVGAWLGNGLTLGATGIIASSVAMDWKIQ